MGTAELRDALHQHLERVKDIKTAAMTKEADKYLDGLVDGLLIALRYLNEANGIGWYNVRPDV